MASVMAVATPATTAHPLRQAGAPALGITFGGLQPPTRLDSFSSLVGRRPATIMWYSDWMSNPIRPYYLDSVFERGATPIITWEPDDHTKETLPQPAFRLAQIAGGIYDKYIRAVADSAAAYKRTFYIRLAHEMNGSWYAWGAGAQGNTPTDYVRAWQRVVAIFRQEGATNVRWIWSPNVVGYGVPSPLPYYPGSNWVDAVGMDGYNDGHPWVSLKDAFLPTYRLLAPLDKPLIIAETASAEGVPGQKADWITSAYLKDLPQSLPLVSTVIWFDLARPRGNWPIESSNSALQAYRTVAGSA